MNCISLGVERTPTRTRQVICAQNPTRDTIPIEHQCPYIKDTCLSISTSPFHLLAQSLRCQSSENCCSINRLSMTRHIPLSKAENIEEFIQPASGKPDPEPFLISAYVPDIQPETDFLCLFHTYSPYGHCCAPLQEVQGIVS